VAENFHKPTLFSANKFEAFQGGEDPAHISRVAHETAQALLNRVRSNPDPATVERLVAYTDENGIDAVAELWSRATPRSLPGALWRIYLIRMLIRQDPEGCAYLYHRGTDAAATIDPLVAGAAVPTGPDEIIVLADEILRGLFTGDFAVALDRGAAYCRVTAAGAASIADDLELTEPHRSSELTTRALRFSTTAAEFAACARLWRRDSLE
jgi:hypothetical protein